LPQDILFKASWILASLSNICFEHLFSLGSHIDKGALAPTFPPAENATLDAPV
jgi:hypothetical protein